MRWPLPRNRCGTRSRLPMGSRPGWCRPDSTRRSAAPCRSTSAFWSHGIVTDYTPTRRFAYAEPWPIATTCRRDHDLSSLTPIATEFLIESASGGSCVIRVVTSAYGSGADWENEFFAEMIDGWLPMLDNLATHLNEAA